MRRQHAAGSASESGIRCSRERNWVRCSRSIWWMWSWRGFRGSLNADIRDHTVNFFRVFTNMPERLEIITSQRKNGCLMEQLLCTEVLLNWEQRLNMIFRRRKILATKGFQWTTAKSAFEREKWTPQSKSSHKWIFEWRKSGHWRWKSGHWRCTF